MNGSDDDGFRRGRHERIDIRVGVERHLTHRALHHATLDR